MGDRNRRPLTLRSETVRILNAAQLARAAAGATGDYVPYGTILSCNVCSDQLLRPPPPNSDSCKC